MPAVTDVRRAQPDTSTTPCWCASTHHRHTRDTRSPQPSAAQPGSPSRPHRRGTTPTGPGRSWDSPHQPADAHLCPHHQTTSPQADIRNIHSPTHLLRGASPGNSSLMGAGYSSAGSWAAEYGDPTDPCPSRAASPPRRAARRVWSPGQEAGMGRLRPTARRHRSPSRLRPLGRAHPSRCLSAQQVSTCSAVDAYGQPSYERLSVVRYDQFMAIRQSADLLAPQYWHVVAGGAASAAAPVEVAAPTGHAGRADGVGGHHPGGITRPKPSLRTTGIY